MKMLGNRTQSVPLVTSGAEKADGLKKKADVTNPLREGHAASAYRGRAFQITPDCTFSCLPPDDGVSGLSRDPTTLVSIRPVSQLDRRGRVVFRYFQEILLNRKGIRL